MGIVILLYHHTVEGSVKGDVWSVRGLHALGGRVLDHFCPVHFVGAYCSDHMHNDAGRLSGAIMAHGTVSREEPSNRSRGLIARTSNR